MIINYKNYNEIMGEGGGLTLARAAEEVASRFEVEIVLAPPTLHLADVSRAVEIPVIAQHVDPAEPGSSTGSILAEFAKICGARGSLVNHSEKRLAHESIEKLVKKLRELSLMSVVCAQDPQEVERLSRLSPDFIAIEPPELIGSGIAVSKARPEVVLESIGAVSRVNPKVVVICGAGIVSGEDVAAALRLGTRGVLVASAIIRAKDWRAKIEELALPLSRGSA